MDKIIVIQNDTFHYMSRAGSVTTVQVKISLKEIGAQKVDWILMTWDRYWQQAAVNIAQGFLVP